MGHARQFRFGVIVKAPRSAEDFAAYAKRIESLGFSTMFVPDHFVDHALAPVPTAMAAAMATSMLRVGTLVLGNDYRHPVVLANEAATIDLLSDGRLELGVGAGWMTADYDKGGFRLDPPSTRITRLDESLTVMKIAPSVGSTLSADSWAFPNALPNESEMPITSPVDLISGPSMGSNSRNLLKGKTASLTEM